MLRRKSENKNARDSEYIKQKYKTDPEFREKVINASKKRYYSKKHAIKVEKMIHWKSIYFLSNQSENKYLHRN